MPLTRKFKQKKVLKAMKTRNFGQRKFKRKNRKVNPSRNLIGFPASQKVTMRYADDFALDPSALFPIQTYTYRANSIFDPDATGGGHQPIGHDEWAAFYNKYVVIGSKITLSCVANSTTVPNIVGIMMSSQSSISATTMTAIVEQGLTNYQLLQGAVNGLPILKSVTKSYSARTWHNNKDPKDADAQEALFTADPADQVYFHVVVGSYDGSSDTASVTGFLTIDYIVILKDPKELIQS